MNPTTESGDGAIVPYTTSEETPHPDTTQYRIDYRWRDFIPEYIEDGDGIVRTELYPMSWHKETFIAQAPSILALYRVALAEIKRWHPGAEIQIRKVTAVKGGAE